MGSLAKSGSTQAVFRRAVLVACVMLLAAQWSCQKSGNAGAVAKIQPNATSEAPLASFKPLDDQHNPYRSQYQEWDRWLVSNCKSVHRGYKSNTARSAGAKGQMAFTTMIDAAGYVVPAVESRRRYEEAQKNRTEESFDQDALYITGAGPADKDILYRYRSQIDEVCAQYYPRIPDWLGSNPPLAAILLPNGEVVTQGPLGNGMNKATPPEAPIGNDQPSAKASPAGSGSGNNSNQGWYRYDATGKQLGFTAKPAWWFLYYDANAHGLPAGKMTSRRDGYTIFTDPTTGAITSVYDYDGTRLDAVEPPLRDLHPFIKLRSYRLAQYYKAQNLSARLARNAE